MNITLSVDENLVDRSREVAKSMGLSLNQAIRNYLEQLAGGNQAEEEITELEQLSNKSNGRSRGWKFDRDELHERT